MKRVLSIAGSDCSGGAGIQADLKTMAAHKIYGMSAITALTAQNTTGVYGVIEADADFVGKQLDCVFEDIYPHAVKIGMVSSTSIIEIIAQKLIEYKAQNIVLDPVMISTSGSKLLNDDAIFLLKTKLIPLANIITPNLPEAECLCGFEIHTSADMVKSAKAINEYFKGNILIKGGHLTDTADDLLYINGHKVWFKSKKIDNPNTHGTGCTLSSAIACNLALGMDIESAVRKSKDYISGALNAQLNLGKGSGPLNHMYEI